MVSTLMLWGAYRRVTYFVKFLAFLLEDVEDILIYLLLVIGSHTDKD